MRPLQFVKLVNRNAWLLGDSPLVQWSNTRQHGQDLMAQWPDGGGYLSLRKPSHEQTFCSSEPQVESRLIHEAGDSSAIWAIGSDTICKVKIKTRSVCSETDIIAHVRQNLPSLPLPDILYSYDDHEDCTALFLRRVRGETLRDAWTKLTEDERDTMVDQVAHYCTLMASLTSDSLAGVKGACLLEPYLYTTKDTPLAPLTVGEARSLFAKFACGPPDTNKFHFYHADLGPGNIIVYDGVIAAIIDWESAGYYPLFWIATKPSVSPGLDFHPAIDGVEEHEWRKRLKERLMTKGYPWMATWWEGWRKAVKSDWH